MNLDLTPTFERLEDALPGVVDTARMAWSVTHLRRAIERAEWSRAVDMLCDVAVRLAERDVDEQPWRELLFGLAWAQDTATLTIFNSNDIKGYLEPCG